jgi:hypothetical protein
VFAHACRLGAEGIVSKKVDGTYWSGPYPVWIKVRNRSDCVAHSMARIGPLVPLACAASQHRVTKQGGRRAAAGQNRSA